ncbi:MAG: PKD domain-containing protein [Planctomycetota bacterium]|nr:PKD domain-containing protein [Planctomycetota bacterium]
MTIDGNGVTRSGVVVAPSFADDNSDSTTGGVLSNAFLIVHDTVTIKDLTIDGAANTGLAGDHNFRHAIITDFGTGTYSEVVADNLSIKNIYRKGIGLYSGNGHATGNQILNSSFDHVGDTSSAYEATFAIAAFGADVTISGNAITNSAAGIGTNYFNAAYKPQATITGNSFTAPITIDDMQAIGLDLSGLAAGSTVGGAGALANTIDMTGGTDDDLGVVLQYINGGDDVVLTGNDITVGGGDTGVMVYWSEPGSVTISDNTISGGDTGTGVEITSDSIFGEAPDSGPAHAALAGNTIDGFGTGVLVHGTGVQAVSALIGDTASNTITSAAAGTGILVVGASASATITDNALSVTGGAIGIEVDGGTTTISGNSIYDNDTGIWVHGGGAATVSGNDFDDASSDNATDFLIDTDAGTVTLGDNNQFAGDDYFIDNRSAQAFDLTSLPGTVLDETDNFRIEDKMFHATDDTASGVITWVTGNLFVSAPGTGANDETIQNAIDAATAGNQINIEAGTHTEGGQIVVDKDLAIVGEDTATTILTPGFDTGDGGDARGWWLVEDGVDLDISEMTLDGTGNNVYQAFRHKGTGSFDQMAFENILYNESGPDYSGVAIAAFNYGSGDVDVTNSTFDNIGRIGVLYFDTGGTFQGNTYTGKGAGDWLDYALDISAGAVVNVIDNTITNNLGVASVDGSTSAGILVTTYFGAGTTATLTGNNVISGNTAGIAIGYDAADNSVVNITGATISSNDVGVEVIGGHVAITGSHLSGNTTGVAVYENGTATIVNNPTSITGGTVGIDVDGGTAFVEGTDLTGNTIGLLVQNGGIVDAGQLAGGTDFTGLGGGTASSGVNDFSSYTATATAASGAIVNLNADTVSGPQGTPPDVAAFNNTWFSANLADIETVIHHDADDNGLGFVDYAELSSLNFSVAPAPVANEGSTVTVSGSFINDPQAHTLDIDWGDTTSTTATLAQGVFAFDVDHVYADDAVYTIIVTVTDSQTPANVLADSTTHTVNNEAPVVTPAADQSINEGDTLSIDVASFIDPGTLDTHTATIDWNDGSPVESGAVAEVPFGPPGSLMGMSGTVSGSHTYADNGTYTVTVTVFDDDGSSDVETFQVQVDNVNPLLDTLFVTSVDEDGTVHLTGTYSDVGTQDTHDLTIDWGEGAPETVVVAGGTFDVTHQYLDDNPTATGSDDYTVGVTLTDDDGGTDTGSVTATVTNVNPVVSIVGAPATVSEGTLISLSANVTDQGTLDTFTYAWSVTKNGNPYDSGSDPAFSFTPDDGDAVYEVSVTVTDDDTGVADDSATINVTNVVPTIALSGDASVDEGSYYALTLGAITDPGDDTVSQYVVFWGDNTSNTYTTDGVKTHYYDDDALVTGPISVTLIDDDGAHSGAGQQSRDVNNVAPTATLINGGAVNEGSPGMVVVVSQDDVSDADQAAGFTYGYDFNNDGDFDDPDELDGTSLTNVTVPGEYLDDDPSKTIRVEIRDKDGGTTSYTTDIIVNNVAPTIDAGPDGTAFVGSAFNQTGTITDPGNDEWSGQVNYDGGPVNDILTVVGKTFQLDHTYTSPGTYTISISLHDGDGGSAWDTVEVIVIEDTLRVVDFTSNPSGFDVQFSRAIDLDVLNLYDGIDASLDLPDLTLVKDGTETIDGSVVWDAGTNTMSFVKTGGVLASGNYLLTLVSGSDAIVDTSGNLLDGDSNGTTGDDYTTSFSVAAGSARVVSLPDFARGPGQDVDVPATASEFSVRIDDATNVVGVDFTLRWDTTLLNVTGVSLSSALSAASWQITTNMSTPGEAVVSVFGSQPLAGGPLELVSVEADVPASAPYGAAQVVRIEDLRVNEDLIAAVADQAFHKVAYLGDASGNARYYGLDPSLISRVVVGLDSGFDAYGLTDPIVVADVTLDGTLSALDSSYVAQKTVGLTRPEIPDLPATLPPIPPAGVDPTLALPTGGWAIPGETVTLPVAVTDSADGIMSALVKIYYDTDVFDLDNADISLGSLVAGLTGDQQWSLTPNVDDTTGTITVLLNSSEPLSEGTGTGDLLDIDFQVRSDAPAGLTALDINEAQSYLNGGALVLTAVDGDLTVPIPADFNLDGKVDVTDLGILTTHYGQSGMTWLEGDATGDGDVDVADLGVLATYYGTGTSTSMAALAGEADQGVLPDELASPATSQTAASTLATAVPTRVSTSAEMSPVSLDEQVVGVETDQAHDSCAYGPQRPSPRRHISIDKAHAHDAALTRSMQRESDRHDTWMAEISWAHQFEQMRHKREAAKKQDDANKDAIDKIMTSYWF